MLNTFRCPATKVCVFGGLDQESRENGYFISPVEYVSGVFARTVEVRA